MTYLDQLRIRLARNQRIECPTKELYSFAPISGFADLVERVIENGERNKIYHYGGLTKVTYFELAKAFAKRFGYDTGLVYGKQAAVVGTRFDSSGIEVPKSDFSLNSSALVNALKIKPFLLEESLDLLDKQLIPHL